MGEPTDYKVPPPETVQELAKLVRCTFSLETRDNGSEYWTHNRCAPEWISELVRTAHGDMFFLEDYRYRFIVHALDELEEAEDVDEAGHHWEFEPYLARLADWLGSHNHRFSYCDDWADEMGQPEDTYHLLAGGHLQERLEVLDSVRASLEAQLQVMATA